MFWMFENGDKIGGLATLGTMAIAILALMFAVIQILVVRNAQREATAKDIYRDYLKLAFENPKYSSPAFGDWREKSEWIRDNKYRWFVAFMLNSCDEILKCKRNDVTWHEVIESDLSLHIDYLRSDAFNKEEKGWGHFSPELRQIFQKLNDGCR